MSAMIAAVEYCVAYELDLPEPLGPMIEVKYESPKGKTWCPLYDLKSASWWLAIRIVVDAGMSHTEELEADQLAHGCDDA